MPELKIKVRTNGPYLVDASQCPVELVDADGNKYDLTGKQNFALCRCGGSVNKPFCDGSHSKIGFQGAESAVKRSESGT
jgi:CDGSH-type Zn-finger protein